MPFVDNAHERDELRNDLTRRRLTLRREPREERGKVTFANDAKSLKNQLRFELEGPHTGGMGAKDTVLL